VYNLLLKIQVRSLAYIRGFTFEFQFISRKVAASSLKKIVTLLSYPIICISNQPTKLTEEYSVAYLSYIVQSTEVA